jgi:ergothioneine biosynthesis protein EgtB
MTQQPLEADRGMRARFEEVRNLTEELAACLTPEDQTVQSMPDVSPTKWHRAHTSWFFETFLLGPKVSSYVEFHPQFAYLFNSYYEALGARHPRAERGNLSRPGVSEVGDYRRYVDKAMFQLLEGLEDPRTLDLVELGIHHEQQHQELLLMDIKHVLSCNPLEPLYAEAQQREDSGTTTLGWIEHPGGTVEIGHRGAGFAFDNEYPLHRAELTPFGLADRAVTSGEWRAFIADGGYQRPELWLSDGWAMVQNEGLRAPLYWSEDPDTGEHQWKVFTLHGPEPVHDADPVVHVTYYEADAYAHWTGYRLPTENEWETIARDQPVVGTLLPSGLLHPSGAGNHPGFFGNTWEWTASAYSPYPGFRASKDAVGEYNGKFMVNQYVLRGGSCVTPGEHVRATYRNFFPASARWAFSGLRLARDLP